MSTKAVRRTFLVAAISSLLLLSCVIEEDLRIHSDGSGTYRVRISIPKQFGQGFGDLRQQAEKNGFEIVQEGETENERFIIMRKDFTDIAALNESHSRFELTMTDTGFMRREYRLRASLGAVGFGSFERRLVVAMPGKISSASDGEVDGSRVRWDGSRRGETLEIVSSGFYLPLTRGQNTALIVLIVGGILLLIVRRMQRRRPAVIACPSCNAPVTANARFCGICGTTSHAAGA